MVHDFTWVYELGQRMGCTMMLCVDRQTACAPWMAIYGVMQPRAACDSRESSRQESSLIWLKGTAWLVTRISCFRYPSRWLTIRLPESSFCKWPHLPRRQKAHARDGKDDGKGPY